MTIKTIKNITNNNLSVHIFWVFVSYSLMIVSINCRIFVKNVPNKTKTFFYLFGLTLTNGNGNNSTKLCCLFDKFKSNYKSFRTLKLRKRERQFNCFGVPCQTLSIKLLRVIDLLRNRRDLLVNLRYNIVNEDSK